MCVCDQVVLMGVAMYPNQFQYGVSSASLPKLTTLQSEILEEYMIRSTTIFRYLARDGLQTEALTDFEDRCGLLEVAHQENHSETDNMAWFTSAHGMEVRELISRQL